MIIGSWKIFNLFEFRHRQELSLEGEASAVVFAAQVVQFAGFIHHQVAAVCAGVAQAINVILFVAGQQQRFGQIVGQ